MKKNMNNIADDELLETKKQPIKEIKIEK